MSQSNAIISATRGRPLGRRRTGITLPGYRAGQAPRNKGRALPAQPLTRHELDALLDTFSGRSATARRDLAIVTVIYRLGLKVGQAVRMERWHYESGADTLTVPATQRLLERTVRVDPHTRRVLDNWLEARRSIGVPPSAPFFCTIMAGQRGRKIRPEQVRDMLGRRARRARIDKRVSPEGLRVTGQRLRELDPSSSIQGAIGEYLDTDTFRKFHPVAYEKWIDALHLLDRDPERHATRIGHDCREALLGFVRSLAGSFSASVKPNAGTISQLRSIIAEKAPDSDRVRQLLDALVSYWGAVSDLAQRQEHGAAREKSALTAEDSRRVVFQTMLVMYEIDRVLKGHA